MTSDSSPDKWVYREHTRVKHAILRGYLGGWLAILGRYHNRVCYFDCFAGRGEYEAEAGEQALGSPVVAMEVAQGLIEKGQVKDFVPVFVERDEANCAKLKHVLEENKSRYPDVAKPYVVHGVFKDVITTVLDSVGSRLAPSFFFIDPFGFAGVPFTVIARILAIPRTEVFITFMYQSINRFLTSQNVESALDCLFGTPTWRDIVANFVGTRREHALRDLYVDQLRQGAGVKCVRAFRVCTDDKLRTLYYLIHAANREKGAVLMKEVMHRQGTPGMFAYLGPNDMLYHGQSTFFGQDDIAALKDYMTQRFRGRELAYDQVKDQCWETPCIDSHFRQALKDLENQGALAVTRVTSKTARGLRGQDRIAFR